MYKVAKKISLLTLSGVLIIHGGISPIRHNRNCTCSTVFLTEGHYPNMKEHLVNNT